MIAVVSVDLYFNIFFLLFCLLSFQPASFFLLPPTANLGLVIGRYWSFVTKYVENKIINSQKKKKKKEKNLRVLCLSCFLCVCYFLLLFREREGRREIILIKKII